MKITFISNFMNHHQLPFCLELVNIIGDDFNFLSTIPIPNYRLKLGYEDLNSKYSFITCLYENNNHNNLLDQILESSNILIIGSANRKVLSRLDNRKNIFFYRERLFKNGTKNFLNIKIMASIFYNHILKMRKNSYLLCASSYTSRDYSLLGLYKRKSYKWGYFPASKEYNLDMIRSLKTRNSTVKILWVGRLIDWKHPEFAIKIAEKLKDQGLDFVLNIVGVGEMYNELENQILNLNLSSFVNLKGSMSPTEVRRIMEESNILLVTSSFYEGWGAVVNEGMNSCCVVISSNSVGSVPFLIKHKENGFICEYNNLEQFVYSIKENIMNRKSSIEIGIKAYNTITSKWNARIAAERFCYLCNNIDDIESVSFENGPLSSAEIIHEKYSY